VQGSVELPVAGATEPAVTASLIDVSAAVMRRSSRRVSATRSTATWRCARESGVRPRTVRSRAAVRDVFSNCIIGWRCSDRCDTDLVLGALEYAIWSRDVRDRQLIHHSDRGSTYTSFRFATRLADHGILPSMGSVGDSYDNALMENFFSTLKIELVYRRSWHTRDEAENAIFAYIDGWYNTERVQKDLGWRSPHEYEAAWYAQQTSQAKPATLQPAPIGDRF
jgi:putative transposase